MTILPDLIPGQLSALVAPGSANRIMLNLVARLAQNTHLRVLDGGNCFNAYTVASLLRRRTSRVNVALGRIRVARAFTCYQMAALLEDTPADTTPTLVLNLLATFYDESVSLDERQRLLHDSTAELRRLSSRAPMMVSVRLPKPEQLDRMKFVEILEDAADRVWRFEPLTPALPPRLF